LPSISTPPDPGNAIDGLAGRVVGAKSTPALARIRAAARARFSIRSSYKEYFFVFSWTRAPRRLT
jgi:hypothetical protein